MKKRMHYILIVIQIRDYFKGYIEDYNTATMPSTKYYNYEQWEMDEFRRKQEKKSKSFVDIPEYFNDEEERRRELQAAKAIAEKREFDELLGKMVNDKDRLESMRRQELLKTQLKSAYKQGDMVTVKRIEKLLAPDEDSS
jgi:hypothetical protein